MSYVTSTRLNLRDAPGLDAGIILTLPRNHPVSRRDVSQALPAGWVAIETEFAGRVLEGFVDRRFLRRVAQRPSIDAQPPRAAHLANRGGSNTHRTMIRWAYPLNEPDAPRSATRPISAADLGAIVDWLGVEQPQHRRYWPGVDTYCNIYAFDVVDLAGGYIPRVWWSRDALRRLAAGEPQTEQYGVTVSELNANALHTWLGEYGRHFGWREVASLDEAQAAANSGRLALITASTRSRASGHITVVLPEFDGHAAVRQDDIVIAPLQSQAGRHNKARFAAVWWTSSRFPDWGIWVAD